MPPGIYNTGGVKLCSNLTFHIDAGAVIKVSLEEKDDSCGSLLYAESCENVTICGKGIIDRNYSKELRCYERYRVIHQYGGQRRGYKIYK